MMKPGCETSDPIRVLDLKVGFSCNNNCLFCVVGHLKGKQHDFSTREIKDTMSQCRRNYNGIALTGGEFTIRKDCLEILRHARELGYHITIQTNGRTLSCASFCGEIVDAAGPDVSFLISPHSSDESIHNFLTRADSWKQTMKAIVLLLEMNQVLGTNSVINKLNYKGAPDLSRLLVAMGVKSMTFAFVQAMGNAEKNIATILPRKSEAAPYIREAFRIGMDNDVTAFTESLPLCFLTGGYEYCAKERVTHHIRMIIKGKTVGDFKESRKTDEMIKGPNCHRCVYDKFCEGPRKQYPAYYGWSEFIPVE